MSGRRRRGGITHSIPRAAEADDVIGEAPQSTSSPVSLTRSRRRKRGKPSISPRRSTHRNAEPNLVGRIRIAPPGSPSAPGTTAVWWCPRAPGRLDHSGDSNDIPLQPLALVGRHDGLDRIWDWFRSTQIQSALHLTAASSRTREAHRDGAIRGGGIEGLPPPPGELKVDCARVPAGASTSTSRPNATSASASRRRGALQVRVRSWEISPAPARPIGWSAGAEPDARPGWPAIGDRGRPAHPSSPPQGGPPRHRGAHSVRSGVPHPGPPDLHLNSPVAARGPASTRQTIGSGDTEGQHRAPVSSRRGESPRVGS